MAPIPTPIFHITPIENLRMILEAGELRAKRALDQEDRGYTNIAHRTIQDRRAHTRVPCGPRGVLHDYVPFYFGPRSPMLFHDLHGAMWKDSQAGKGPSSIWYRRCRRCRRRDWASCSPMDTGSWRSRISTMILAQLDAVDWPLMNTRYWADTDDDLDRKRRRQAEFLVHQGFPMTLIQEIGVMDQQRKPKQKPYRRTRTGHSGGVKHGWYY